MEQLCSYWTDFIKIDILDVFEKSFEKKNQVLLTHNSGRVTQICVFNTVKLGTSASSP